MAKGVETKLQTLIGNLEEAVDSEAKKNGKSRESCLTDRETKGKRSISLRVKNGEVVLLQTDKSGKQGVLKKEDYIDALQVHLKDDPVVERVEVDKDEKVLSAHAQVVARILRYGANHGHEERVVSAVASSNSPIPPF